MGGRVCGRAAFGTSTSPDWPARAAGNRGGAGFFFLEASLTEGAINADDLRRYVSAIEDINEQIKELQDDRSEWFRSAKAAGYDVPTLKSVIKARKMEREQREQQFYLLETYLRALGDLGGTPLGDAYLSRLAPEGCTVEFTTAEGDGVSVTNEGGRRTVKRIRPDSKTAGEA